MAGIARELVERVAQLNRRALELERQIKPLVLELGPSLLDISGCGALTAAKIIGETAGAGRFRSKSAYARWNGTAPIPVWLPPVGAAPPSPCIRHHSSSHARTHARTPHRNREGHARGRAW